jgi:Flp pilus assembly protein TadD
VSGKEIRLAALLVAIVAASYLPMARAGYIWDDDAHVTANPALRDAHGLLAIWTTLDATPQYYPLTHTSFWIEHALWGFRPLGYHVDNVLLHAASACVLWRLLVLLELPGAFLAAAVFAVHPVHVESVAWVTERKNVLSGLFYLGSARVFLGWALGRERGPLRPWIAAALYASALLSKTVTSTLPAALAIVLWWKRGSVSRREAAWLLPMLAVGAVFGSITRHLETALIRSSTSEWTLTAWDRISLAGQAPWFYLGKLVWPRTLIFVYPRFTIDASSASSWIGVVAGVALFATLWTRRERIGRGPAAAAAFFVVTLAPALGFFDVYPMRYSWVADHFQYLASLGPIVLLCATAARWKRASLVAGTLVVALLAGRTFARTFAYADEETLWRDTIARNPAAWLAHNDLGILLARRGATVEAEREFRAVLTLKPDHAGAAANLGYALELEGRDSEAAEALDRAVVGNPRDANARAHLVRCLLRLGRPGDALPHAIEAARLAPEDPDVLCDAGSLLSRAGRFNEGIRLLERALALRPEFPRARRNLDTARRGAVSSEAPRIDSTPEAPR